MKEMTESEAADHFYDKWLLAVSKTKRLEQLIQDMRYAEDQNVNNLVVENTQLSNRIKQLEDALYAAERQANVDMGR